MTKSEYDKMKKQEEVEALKHKKENDKEESKHKKEDDHILENEKFIKYFD